MKQFITYQNGGSIVMLAFLLASSFTLFSQQHESRTWQGYFMNDFRTVISVTQIKGEPAAGTIWMYAGEEKLQEDKLTEVLINTTSIEFIIPAKETTFKGKLTENEQLLSGHFIFPDGSMHPFEARIEDSVKITNVRDPKGAKMLSQELSLAAMHEDLELLATALEENHPALYAFCSREDFEDAFRMAKVSCEEPLPKGHFFYMVSSLLEKVGCSHTAARINIDEWKSIIKSNEFLPIHFTTDGERIFYTGSGELTASAIIPGAEIISINGMNADQILSSLCDVIPSDSRRLSTKLNNINQHFVYWYHVLDPSTRFFLEYKLDDNLYTLQLDGVPLQINADPFALFDSQSPVQFSFDKKKDVAYLNVKSFQIFNAEEYFKQLDSIFTTIHEKKISNLVLDLRNNSGGHPKFSASLFSYLSDKAFTYFEPVPEVSEFENLYVPMQAAENAFRGQLFVRVNGGCLSSTGHLISLLDYHTDAVFLGQEPGSTHTCNDLSRQVVLQGAGIEVNIPRATFRTAVPDSGNTLKAYIEIADEENAEVFLESFLGYSRIRHSDINSFL